MAQEDKNEEIFKLSLAALSELSSNNNPDKIMIIFKVKVLSLSGFKPHLDSCVTCNSSLSGQTKFSLNLGGLLCQKCAARDTFARSIFRGTVATILHIEKNEFRNTLNLGINPQIKKELDLILNSFLNYHLGKELKSQKVIAELVKAGALL
jgi:DNA repair protein RecO (recombination protein O)